MKGLRKISSLLCASVLTMATLSFSGCVIIVSDRLVEDGIHAVDGAVEDVQENGFGASFTRASLEYVFVGDDNTLAVRRICNNCRLVEIPNEFEGYPIVKISKDAFKGTNIRSAKIGANVAVIEEGAFEGCEDLAKVSFEKYDGWTRDGSPVSEKDLKDEEKAATLLRYGGYWERK